MSVTELVYLERLAYCCDENKNNNFIDQEAYYAINIDSLIKYDENHVCPLCSCEKIRGKTCIICGYLEGEWVCSECSAPNFVNAWTCSFCDEDRVKSSDTYYCGNCDKMNNGINYCRYCPAMGICIQCNDIIFPYKSVFCKDCGGYRIGLDDCSNIHAILCIPCYKANEE